MPTTSNFGWNTPADTDLVKDGALAIRTLGNNIDASMADLKGGTTGQVLSKNSNTDMDFTWVTSDDANAIQNAIVDAKGDLITATAADTPARLAVGSNGETLVADSAASTGLRYIPYGSINYQINGGFDVWQRGTSLAVGTAFTYTADRWLGWRNALAAGMTVSRQNSDLNGFQYFARIQRDSGNTSTQTLFFGSSLETQIVEMLQGQFVTLSFWARAGANYSGGTFDAYIFTGTGTDQSISALATNAGSIGNSLTTSWVRYSITTTAAIASTATSLGVRFQYAPSGTAGAADCVDLAGVQIELGQGVTPFRRSGGTLQGELAACQRYYHRFTGSDQYSYFNAGNAQSANEVYIPFPLGVTMRTKPTAIDTSGMATLFLEHNNATTVTNPTAIILGPNAQGPDIAQVTIQKSGAFTTGMYYRLVANMSFNAYIGFSAEL